jgi:hypothetical protein
VCTSSGSIRGSPTDDGRRQRVRSSPFVAAGSKNQRERGPHSSRRIGARTRAGRALRQARSSGHQTAETSAAGGSSLPWSSRSLRSAGVSEIGPQHGGTSTARGNVGLSKRESTLPSMASASTRTTHSPSESPHVLRNSTLPSQPRCGLANANVRARAEEAPRIGYTSLAGRTGSHPRERRRRPRSLLEALASGGRIGRRGEPTVEVAILRASWHESRRHAAELAAARGLGIPLPTCFRPAISLSSVSRTHAMSCERVQRGRRRSRLQRPLVSFIASLGSSDTPARDLVTHELISELRSTTCSGGDSAGSR